MVYGLEAVGVKSAGITGGGETFRIGIGARKERNLRERNQRPHLRGSKVVTAIETLKGIVEEVDYWQKKRWGSELVIRFKVLLPNFRKTCFREMKRNLIA